MFTIKGVLISKERHSWDRKSDFYLFKKKKKDFLKPEGQILLSDEIIHWIKFTPWICCWNYNNVKENFCQGWIFTLLSAPAHLRFAVGSNARPRTIPVANAI